MLRISTVNLVSNRNNNSLTWWFDAFVLPSIVLALLVKYRETQSDNEINTEDTLAITCWKTGKKSGGSAFLGAKQKWQQGSLINWIGLGFLSAYIQLQAMMQCHQNVIAPTSTVLHSYYSWLGGTVHYWCALPLAALTKNYWSHLQEVSCPGITRNQCLQQHGTKQENLPVIVTWYLKKNKRTNFTSCVQCTIFDQKRHSAINVPWPPTEQKYPSVALAGTCSSQTCNATGNRLSWLLQTSTFPQKDPGNILLTHTSYHRNNYLNWYKSSILQCTTPTSYKCTFLVLSARPNAMTAVCLFGTWRLQ